MGWQVELTRTATADLDDIFEFCYSTALGRGDTNAEAFARASGLVARILGHRVRLANVPHIGTRHRIAGRTVRHVTFDRAIFWFTLDEDAQVVRIEGIFHGGQDHMGRMLRRFMDEGGA
ncbi:type II toxin-antitoxin system RelE/ParE family toxin [Rhodobacteraceae bacterium CCMM004]|nr:type II toxin-antitoxin system RelE/ParE family toxin [Rhodobacteraceae bacterium CCMM004]